jgi:uncharacterized phage-like protein YoqJ
MGFGDIYMHYMDLLRKVGEVKYVHNVDDVSFSAPVCTFTGHRPAKLPFRGESDPFCLNLRAALGNAVEESYRLGYRNYLCGMALGVDTWAAMEVLRLKYFHDDIKLFAAIPYMNQSKGWYGWEQDRYDDILKLCERVFVVCDEPSRRAPIIRDAFMVNHSSRIIAVYDGSPSGGTAATVGMAKRKNLDMVTLDPRDFLPNIKTPFDK